jgi:hypothetical protein
MPTVESSIRIGVPPSEVTRVLLDADLAPRWTDGLERLELIEGEPGQAGSVGHAHYLEGGRRYVLVDVLEEVTPGRYYRSRVAGGGIAATVETTLEPVGRDATQLTVRWVGKGTNPLTKVTLALMKRQITKRTESDLKSLRDLGEKG